MSACVRRVRTKFCQNSDKKQMFECFFSSRTSQMKFGHFMVFLAEYSAIWQPCLVLRCHVAASWWPWDCVSWDADLQADLVGSEFWLLVWLLPGLTSMRWKLLSSWSQKLTLVAPPPRCSNKLRVRGLVSNHFYTDIVLHGSCSDFQQLFDDLKKVHLIHVNHE